MPKAQRDKGLLGQREVRKEFEAAGFVVRSLERTGDNLVVCKNDLLLHLETKRREKIELHTWIKQAESEAPPNAVPLLCWRRSRDPWHVDLRLSEFLSILRVGHV